MKAKYLIPLAVFLALLVFLGLGLNRDPRELPSPLVGKPAPEFLLPVVQDPSKQFGTKDMQGKVWLLNVWASWCVSCRAEHEVLKELAKSELVPIYGLNYKDARNDALAWLGQLGDPYVVSVSDESGRVGIDYGVYGVPETYVIDKQGIIRYKQIGPVTHQNLQEKILPVVRGLL